MSGPGNTCVHGAKVPYYTDQELEEFEPERRKSKLEFAELVEKTVGDMCAGRQQISVPSLSRFMSPGHIDEVYSMIKTGPGPCDQTVLVASPELGLRLMRNSDESIVKKSLNMSTRENYFSSNSTSWPRISIPHIENQDAVP